jgi:hypothetical protein
MSIKYPDSWWYTVNGPFYWPHRSGNTFSTPNAILETGAHRYFRFNVKSEYANRLQQNAAAAGVWVRNLACYEVPGGYFCEGYMEPKYEGITYKTLADKLHPWAMEVSRESVDFIDETLQDIDDLLTFDYHMMHPVRLAGPDDLLHQGQYYPVAAFYRGNRPGAFQKPPPASAVAQIVRKNHMDFYQPYPTNDPVAVTFVLYTKGRSLTPRQLNDMLRSDYVGVNLIPLNTEDQKSLQKYDAGANLPDAVVTFFEKQGETAKEAFDIMEFIIKAATYAALGGLAYGAALLGFRGYKMLKAKKGK